MNSTSAPVSVPLNAICKMARALLGPVGGDDYFKPHRRYAVALREDTTTLDLQLDFSPVTTYKRVNDSCVRNLLSAFNAAAFTDSSDYTVKRRVRQRLLTDYYN